MIVDPNTSRVAYLGGWTRASAAALAYDRAAAWYYGPDCARVNFPSKRGSIVPADAETLVAETFGELKSKKSRRFRGVTFQYGAWVASIADPNAPSGTRMICRSASEQDAALAWDREALAIFGAKAKLNFPLAPAKQRPTKARASVTSEQREKKRGPRRARKTPRPRAVATRTDRKMRAG
jgi:hypothetical protein